MSMNTRKRGFTLIELLVTMAIMGIAAGLVLAAVRNARQVGRQTVCISNLRQILHGLSLFYMDTGSFPSDEGTGSYLFDALQPYVPDGKVFVCPADQDESSRREYRSYQGFYVFRPGTGGGEFVIGCPRHRDNRVACNLLSEGAVIAAGVEPVLWNGQPIAPGATAVGGAMSFVDNSRVTLDGASKAILIQSFRLSDGTLYSLLKVGEDYPNGSMDVTVTPGSRFEIITPAGIVGVRGTQFSVQTESDGMAYRTRVQVVAGVVVFTPVEGSVATATATTGAITMTRSKGKSKDKGKGKGKGNIKGT